MSLTICGYRKRCDETMLHKMYSITHILWSHRKRCIEKAIHKNVQSNSLACNHGEEYDEIAFHTRCAVAHKLLVIGKM